MGFTALRRLKRTPPSAYFQNAERETVFLRDRFGLKIRKNEEGRRFPTARVAWKESTSQKGWWPLFGWKTSISICRLRSFGIPALNIYHLEIIYSAREPSPLQLNTLAQAIWVFTPPLSQCGLWRNGLAYVLQGSVRLWNHWCCILCSGTGPGPWLDRCNLVSVLSRWCWFCYCGFPPISTCFLPPS